MSFLCPNISIPNSSFNSTSVRSCNVSPIIWFLIKFSLYYDNPKQSNQVQTSSIFQSYTIKLKYNIRFKYFSFSLLKLLFHSMLIMYRIHVFPARFNVIPRVYYWVMVEDVLYYYLSLKQQKTHFQIHKELNQLLFTLLIYHYHIINKSAL